MVIMNKRILLSTLLGATLLTSPLVSSGKGHLSDPPRISYEKVPSMSYANVKIGETEWKTLDEGLEFCRIPIWKDDTLVDVVATLRIDPKQYGFRVFNTYEPGKRFESHTIDDWMVRGTGPKDEKLVAAWNSAQYMADPWGCPVAPIIVDGKRKGPAYNKKAEAVFVAEPTDGKSPLADLVDFHYEPFDPKTTSYRQAVEHWLILLDEDGKIRVPNTTWQANRTVMADDKEGNILVMTTEGGYFTLFNFGKFLKESGLNIATAMSMDGGYEAELAVRSDGFSYTTFGQFETYGPDRDVTVLNARCPIMGVIGAYRREK